jgi:hypothetical protein
MTRRHRYAVALVCLAALVAALALPGVGLPFGLPAEPLTIVAAPAVIRDRIEGRAHPIRPAVRVHALAPRAPPLA